MLPRFLRAILLPRAALAASGSVALGGFGDDGVLPTLGVWLLSTFWTFASTTGGVPYRRPRPEPKPEPPKKDGDEDEGAAGAIAVALLVSWAPICAVYGAVCFLIWLGESARSGKWGVAVASIALIDGALTVLLLWWFNGWQSFARAEAGREVRRAHRRYRDLIGDEYPLAVVLSELHALGSEVSPAEAWKAASDILRRIHEIARKATEDRAKAAEGRRKAESEREKPAPLSLPREEPMFTPPLDLDEGPDSAESLTEKPAPDLRAEWEETRERIKAEAKRRGIPEDVVVGELERIDEEFRNRMGGTP